MNMEPANEISITEKIFSLARIVDETNFKLIKDELIKLVNSLINNDFNSLVQLLYRIDVDENKLKQNLRKNEGADSASLIADMIIKRQLQKIKFSKKDSGDKPQPGQENW